MFIIGVDSSINSPCVCVYNTEDSTFEFYCFTTHLKTKGIKTYTNIDKSGKFCTKIEKQPSKKQYSDLVRSDLEKRIYIAENVFMFLKEYLEDDTKVIFESCSLHSKGKVLELASIVNFLQLMIYDHNHNTEVLQYAPTSVKKAFHGKGNAKKDQMYEAAKNYDLKGTLEDLEEDGYGYKKGSFIEDIVDSYAIVQTYLKEEENASNSN